MNARQLRLFHQIYAATGSLSVARSAARSAGRSAAQGIDAKPSGRSFGPHASACAPRGGKRPCACGGSDGLLRPPAAGVRRAQAAQADIDRAVAALESEAVRRALSGVAVPVFHQGRECGSTVKHSDQLLMFLLKTLRPERYGGGKEAAQAAPLRTFALDLDLSAADGLAGDCAEDEHGENAEGERGE
ncbi:hypothetical protein [Humidesulfovibrio sp.]